MAEESDPAREEVVADLEQQTADQLKKDAERRNVTPPSGSGAGGHVIKEDLVQAIADDEVAPEDTSGRPPAVEVAEALADNVTEIPAIEPREED